jgi:AcrR family transcriptional regulator
MTLDGADRTGKLPAGGRTQAERRRSSDRRMIKAAMQLIAEKGVAGTSLAEIGIAAGYSRGLPAERFGTKLGLMEAVIDSMEAWFARHAPMAVGDSRGLAAVLARADAHVEGALRSPVATTVLYSLSLDSIQVFPELRRRAVALNDSFREGFAFHLREARQAREIPASVDCDVAAALIVSLLRGIFMQWLTDRGHTDLAAVRPQLLMFITHALAGAPPAARTINRRARQRRPSGEHE